MRPVFTHGFVRDYQRLPQSIQRRFDRALRFLLSNPHHPSLRTKKMEGQRDRFTFAIDGDTYILYRIGPHDIERHPV
jgi:mRNA interferase RelE/StbE